MRNFVQIKTANRSGSGVILSCTVDPKCWGNLKVDEKSYIVLTNYHVIQDIKQDSRDKKRNIRLRILDVNGDEIEQNLIQHIYVESGYNYDHVSDIAALLVIVKDCCNILCTNDVFMGNHSGKLIKTYGYPYILQSNWINQDIAMEGVIQKYTKGEMGLYKIKDDYHSYTNVSDKQLMEGISGAPIYLINESKAYLVGINESICNIGEGNNPFKVVYFIPIERVLSWLASQHIILYRYGNKSVDILWIKSGGMENDEQKEKNKNIVLIGSSGAGKSSFLKTLCQHGEVIGGVGDGQTTRMNIVYELDVMQHNPTIKIDFQSEHVFVEKQKERVRLRRYEWILCQFYNMEKRDIMGNPCCYLQNMIIPLINLKKSNDGLQEKIDEKIEEIEKVINNYDCQNDEVDLISQIMKLYDECIEFMKEIKSDGRLPEDFTWDVKKKESISGRSEQKIENREELEKIKREELEKILKKEEGFYDIEEFSFLDEKENYNKKLQKIFEENFMKDGKLISATDIVEDEKLESNPENNKNKSFIKAVENYYVAIYKTLKELLEHYGIDIEKKLEIDLEMATDKEKRIISKCMKKVERDSLSSIVENIEVLDRVSDTYAYDLYQCNVRRLCLYDTCGFDHIQRQNVSLYYKTVFNTIKEREYNRFSVTGGIDAIVYVKKLDSEKPVELEIMLPKILDMEEATPVFCLFTALDQYVNDKKQIPAKMIWDEEFYEKWKNVSKSNELIYPKIVQNLMEKVDSKFLQMPDYKRERVAGFIKNHMIPYIAKYEINDDNMIALNRNSILFMMKSILQKEWDAHFLSLETDIELEQKLKEAIQTDLMEMFKIASRTDWQDRHHSTITANYRRIYRYNEIYDRKEKDLGFNRTYIDRWDNLFEYGYSKSILSRKGKIIQYVHEHYKIDEIIIYEILANLKSTIITTELGKWEGKNEKNGFRRLIEKLYETVKIQKPDGENVDGDIFKHHKESIANTKDEKIEFLNVICNFEHILKENKEIKDEIVDYFANELKRAIKENNKKFLKVIYQYDDTFRQSVEYIRKIVKKYADCEIKDEILLPVEILKDLNENTKERE